MSWIEIAVNLGAKNFDIYPNVNFTYILRILLFEICIIILNSKFFFKFWIYYSACYICSFTFLLHTQSLWFMSSCNPLTETLILTKCLKKFPPGGLSFIKSLFISLHSVTNGTMAYVLQCFANIHLCYIYSILLTNSFIRWSEKYMSSVWHNLNFSDPPLAHSDHHLLCSQLS